MDLGLGLSIFSLSSDSSGESEDDIKNLTHDDIGSAPNVESDIREEEETQILPDSEDANVVVEDEKTADDNIDKKDKQKNWHWTDWVFGPGLFESPAPCHAHPEATRSSHPQLLGKFQRPRNENPYTSLYDTANIFKYHLVSLHFPREHHFLELENGKAVNPPWIAKVTLYLRDMDVLTTEKHPLPWRNHKFCDHEWKTPPPQVDWDGHPGPDKGAPMFKQSWRIDFGPDHGLSWRAEVTLWAQDQEKIREVLYQRCSVKEMINRETSVCMEALRTEPATTKLWPRRRFFVKYPYPDPENSKDLDFIHVGDETDPDPDPDQSVFEAESGCNGDGKHFCIARDKTVEVDEPELTSIMEEQMERHLFGEEEHDPKARQLWCNLCGGYSYV